MITDTRCPFLHSVGGRFSSNSRGRCGADVVPSEQPEHEQKLEHSKGRVCSVLPRRPGAIAVVTLREIFRTRLNTQTAKNHYWLKLLK